MTPPSTPRRTWDTSFTNLGGGHRYGPAPVLDSYGRVRVFGVAGNNQLVSKVRYTTGSWNASWLYHGGSLDSRPVPLLARDGNLRVFARGSDNSPAYGREPSDFSDAYPWTGLEGDLRGEIAACEHADNRVAAFARTAESKVVTRAWARGGGWQPWETLSGTTDATPHAAARRADGRIALFFNAPGNRLFVITQAGANSGYSEEQLLDGSNFSYGPEAVLSADGRVHVFFVGLDKSLWLRAQNHDDTWQEALRLVTNVGGPVSAVRGWDGRLHLFFRGSDNALWYLTQDDRIDSTGWSEVASLSGGLNNDPEAVLDERGRIIVFVRGGGDSIYFKSQQFAS